MSIPRILLASASPRRAELLRAAGFEFDVLPANVDETQRDGEGPQAYARRIAEAKVAAVAGRSSGRVVLGADTVVAIDREILGKPASAADAARMLRMLSGRTHAVLTAVSVLRPGSRDVETRTEETRVEFAPLSDDDINWYVATGEPSDKAGAYAVQGLGARFVTRIDGSYSNVVGLPITAVYAMLKGCSEGSGRV